MNEELETDKNDSIEKTEMHKRINNVDNYSSYRKIRINHTPTPETTTSDDPPKLSEEPIIDDDETAIATTNGNETTAIKKLLAKYFFRYGNLGSKYVVKLKTEKS